MALNPGQSSNRNEHNWNYSRPNQPGFSTELTGTVVAIQETQAMNFGQHGPTTPKFWPNGNPVWNIRITLCGPSGGYRTFTFAEAGKTQREGKKPSVHIDLFKIAGGEDMMNLIGKTIRISTVQPPQGFSYGSGNPRPWTVEEVQAGPYQLREELPSYLTVPQLLADDGAHGGVVAAPSSAPASTVSQASMPNPVMQPQVGYSPAPTQVQYQQTAQQPVGYAPQVDPGTPVPTSVYDDEMPF